MNAPTVLLSGIRPHTEAMLRAAFPDLDFTTAGAGPSQGSAALAVVALGGDVDAGFRMVRELALGGASVLVLGPTKDADLILRAMRHGAKEYVLADDDEAIAHALREQARPLRGTDGGIVYALFPAKGGVGATTLATNLAGALQRAGERTCLVDLNLDMGDVLAFLDLPGGFSISDVVANMKRLDRELLESSVMRHPASGIHVLAQTHRIEESDRVSPAALGAVLSLLRRHYGAIVLDGLRSFDEVSLAAVDASNQILLVVTQEVPAVRDARRCVDLFRRLGAESKLKLIVNRFRNGHEINPEVVAETVGLPVAATVANDYPAVIRAVNRGQMLLDDAPRAPVTKDVEKLVRTLGHVSSSDAAPGREKRSLLQRFFTPRMSHATE